MQKPVEAFPWPGGGLLIADLDGDISVYTGESETRQILDLTDKIALMGSEKGLLSVGLDPSLNHIHFCTCTTRRVAKPKGPKQAHDCHDSPLWTAAPCAMKS